MSIKVSVSMQPVQEPARPYDKAAWDQFHLSGVFVQAGIKYYVWESNAPLPSGMYQEHIIKADFFWGLVD